MSLYANINVSKTSNEAPATKGPPVKTSKSATLYAGVLAKTPPPPSVPVKETVLPQDTPQPAEAEAPKTAEASALQFKPTIRRIQKIAKPKNTSIPSTVETTTAAPAQTSTVKSFLQDVSKIQEDIANDDVNGFYRTIEGQRLARKNNRKKKRKNNDGQGNYVWTWDDEYDPAHPNDYEAYIDSDEQLREQIEWKRKLEGKDGDEDYEEEDEYNDYRGFAPPQTYEEGELEGAKDEESEYVPEPAAALEMDESGDDVFARRMRMAQQAGINIRPPTPPSAQDGGPDEYDDDGYIDEDVPLNDSKEEPIRIPSPLPQDQKPAISSAQAQTQFYGAYTSYSQPPSLYANAPGIQPTPPVSSSTISSEPVHYASATVFSDPVFYDAPEPTPSVSDVNEPRGSLPGQKDFASRMMSKYGWQKGQSLGSTPTTGLVTPLLMKADKERKGTGVIVNRNKVVEDHGPFGKMTRCIVLFNVVGAGEVDEDLVVEIGEECREKYGEVERVRIVEDTKDRDEEEMVRVFVLFTSELSALRGVNSLDGRLFGGRKLKARFYDVEKFEAGDFR